MREGKKRKQYTTAHEEDEIKGVDERDVLQRMLLGAPLSARQESVNGVEPSIIETDELLTRYLNALPEVIRQSYGDESEATQEAASECRAIASLPCNPGGICSKRAALLFAMRREPELARYFCQRDSGFTNDMVNRILPFIDPPFLKQSCQAPDSYVFMAVIFSQLFEGERLGNWPLEQQGQEQAGEQQAGQ